MCRPARLLKKAQVQGGAPIEQALGSLETFALQVEGGLVPERATLTDFAAFFAGFADASHHGKEEDILFALMIERGFSCESGPLAVMLYEHVVGRGHVGALRRVGEGKGPLSGVESRLVLEHAGAFVPHLRARIQKEDRILYPMALQLLTEPELDEIETAYGVFDGGRKAVGTYDRLDALCERLVAVFRPDPARMAAALNMVGCGMRSPRCSPHDGIDGIASPQEKNHHPMLKRCRFRDTEFHSVRLGAGYD